MIKDYARPSPIEKPRSKRVLWTILVITLAILVPALMYYGKFPKAINPKRHSVTPTPIPQKTKPATPSKKDTADFDFYTLLPKGTENAQ